MGKPIYKVFLLKSTEAWYQLSQEEKDGVFAKIGQSLEEVGAEGVVTCDSSWSSEQWSVFGVQKYPDIEAVQKHAEDLMEMEWFRYVDTMTVLGTEWQEI